MDIVKKALETLRGTPEKPERSVLSRQIDATDIEITDEWKEVLDCLENSPDNLFITGRAGTGKSTLLHYFRSHTKKRVAVLAFTGVAAVNVHGETIHSFFHFKPGITEKQVQKYEDEESELYKHLDTIIIDEASMVRADLLDCIEKFLRLNGPHPKTPFGGVQVVLIGDLYQLPPIVQKEEESIFKEHYLKECRPKSHGLSAHRLLQIISRSMKARCCYPMQRVSSRRCCSLPLKRGCGWVNS